MGWRKVSEGLDKPLPLLIERTGWPWVQSGRRHGPWAREPQDRLHVQGPRARGGERMCGSGIRWGQGLGAG